MLTASSGSPIPPLAAGSSLPPAAPVDRVDRPLPAAPEEVAEAQPPPRAATASPKASRQPPTPSAVGVDHPPARTISAARAVTLRRAPSAPAPQPLPSTSGSMDAPSAA